MPRGPIQQNNVGFPRRGGAVDCPVISNALHPCMDDPRSPWSSAVPGQPLPGSYVKHFMRLKGPTSLLPAVSHALSCT